MNVDEIQFHFANPVMPVKDVKKTATFYKERLGFTVDVLWEKPNYACVSRGGITIEFGEGPPDHVGSGACVIQVSDVDALYKEFKAQEVNLIGDFAARDYGSKDFRITDIDGNLLVFGSALPNKNELIAKRNLAYVHGSFNL
jgi:catechol 2,3-dioxygenase-like lactoylglutathione lyase family enzyme